MTPAEKAELEWLTFVRPTDPGFTQDPPSVPVRTMAEWEELEALVITWRSYPSILTEIVRYASQEVKVIVLCRNQSTKQSAISELQAANVPLNNVQFFIINNNSVWVRDYGPNCVYANDVEELYFVDWIYNRPSRPQDNISPSLLADSLGIAIFETTGAPYDMVNTGGNFNPDGLGSAFASKLILDENKPGNSYGVGPHDEASIDQMMQLFMGIERYIKMETLPYDVIHHIDMHIKLLDEGTLLVGYYPEGVADGPQIEANLSYVLDNFLSPFGKPYRVIRIPQPPDFGGQYPNNNGDYRTYTNSVFVNKTILIPTYEEKYDTTALRIYREAFPGYKVFGINANAMIGANGALHCITKEIGVADPLWIAHDRLDDISDNDLWTGYPVAAQIKHKDGVAAAVVYFTTDTLLGYQALLMTPDAGDPDAWSATIPKQPNGSVIYYYVEATAQSGKTQVRPQAAPAGYFHFKVDSELLPADESRSLVIAPIYPNPASGTTVLPVATNWATKAVLQVTDVLGRVVDEPFAGHLPAGETNLYLRADRYAPGTYFVILRTEFGRYTTRLVVK